MECSKCNGELWFLYNDNEGKGHYKCSRCGREDTIYLGTRRINDSFKSAGVG